MTTIASLIENRLRQIEAQYAAESVRQDRAAGGAVHDPLALAREREQRLWDALQPDKVWVRTPEGHKKLREITDLASGLKAEMRVERTTNGVTPTLRWMTRLNETMENIIKIAASRQSDREALKRPR
jgi:hypothetical protein